jgi:hypothetical protein
MTRDTEYLSSTHIQQNEWVKQITSVKTRGELTNLIINRITSPKTVGPHVNISALDINGQEMEIDIVYDMAHANLIDYDLLNDAMHDIMESVVKNSSAVDKNFLNNCFYIIEELALENCGIHLFEWLKRNETFLHTNNSESGGWRYTYLQGLKAYVYAQKKEAGAQEMWLALWESDKADYWSIAYQGIRFCNLEIATREMPRLFSRKCLGIDDIMYSLWRIKDKAKIMVPLRQALENSEPWAGHAINQMASKLSFEEKQKLVGFLSEKSVKVIPNTPMSPN